MGHLILYWNRHLPANNRPWNFRCNLYSIVDGDKICVMDYKMHLTVFRCLCLYSCSMLCERCIANRIEDWCCFLPLLSNNILLAVISSTSISAPRIDVLILPFRCLLCTNTLYMQHYHTPYCPWLSKKCPNVFTRSCLYVKCFSHGTWLTITMDSFFLDNHYVPCNKRTWVTEYTRRLFPERTRLSVEWQIVRPSALTIKVENGISTRWPN